MEDKIIIGKKMYTPEQAKRTATIALIAGIIMAIVGLVLIPFGILLIIAGVALIMRWRQINACLKARESGNQDQNP